MFLPGLGMSKADSRKLFAGLRRPIYRNAGFLDEYQALDSRLQNRNSFQAFVDDLARLSKDILATNFATSQNVVFGTFRAKGYNTSRSEATGAINTAYS